MKYLSVCSGIEAASVAWEPLGWKPLAFAEIEAFPSAVLEHRWPGVPNLGDLKMLKMFQFAPFDVLIGGTPCQSFSQAGKQKGLSDDRGQLMIHFIRLADRTNPPVVVWENVKGVLQRKDNAFGHLVGRLSGEHDPVLPPGGRWTDAGYVVGPKRTVAWRVLDAKHFGVAQSRERVFVVSSPRSAAHDPRQILFESGSGRRDCPPPRPAIQADFAPDLAPCVGASGRGFARTGESRGHDPVVAVCMRGRAGGAQAELSPDDTAPAIRAASGGSTRPFLAGPWGVRKLTPREVERLFGFPDGYTLIPWRDGLAPDTRRYKALGNSMAVPVIRWIGERIQEALHG